MEDRLPLSAAVPMQRRSPGRAQGRLALYMWGRMTGRCAAEALTVFELLDLLIPL